MPDPLTRSRRPAAPQSASPSTARATPRRPNPQEEAERALDDLERRRSSVSSLRARPRRARAAALPPLPVPQAPNEVGLYVRSFHFDSSFGGGFDGDDRGFSADPRATARIHAGAVLARGRGGFDLRGEIGGRSDASTHPLLGGARGIPRIRGTVDQLDDRTSELRIDYAGSVPLVPGAPDIDAHARFLISEDNPGELRVHVEVRGDAFPNAEALVRDSRGNSVILGVHALHIRQSPATDLPGDGRHRMIEADVTIRRDPDTGEFLSVRYGEHELTIDEWNAEFEAAQPQVGSAPLDPASSQPAPVNSPLDR